MRTYIAERGRESERDKQHNLCWAASSRLYHSCLRTSMYIFVCVYQTFRSHRVCVCLSTTWCYINTGHADTLTYMHTLAQNCLIELWRGARRTSKKHRENKLTRWKWINLNMSKWINKERIKKYREREQDAVGVHFPCCFFKTVITLKLKLQMKLRSFPLESMYFLKKCPGVHSWINATTLSLQQNTISAEYARWLQHTVITTSPYLPTNAVFKTNISFWIRVIFLWGNAVCFCRDNIQTKYEVFLEKLHHALWRSAVCISRCLTFLSKEQSPF